VQLVILCGGLATRLGAIAGATPKLLLEVAGVPFAERVLRRHAERGLRDIVLCTGHLAEPIRAFVGDGARFGARVRYADDGPVLRGTWGALRAAAPLLDERFVVTYGDSLLPVDVGAALRALDDSAWADAAMMVWRNRGAVEPSNVRLERGRVAAYGRDGEPAPDAIDYGATALRREAVLALEEGAPAPLAELWSALAARGALAAVEVPTRFYEIGSPAGLAEAEAAIRAGLFDGAPS
jgi:NDP-sugar pyrophosphorylase family protein